MLSGFRTILSAFPVRKPNYQNRRHSRRLGLRNFSVETLESRALMSATTMEIEPNNSLATATVAQFDPADNAAHLVGTLANRDDKDFFRFTAPATGTMQLGLQTDAGVAVKLEVDSAQGEVFETDPNHGVNSGSFSVTAGQTYSLRVQSQGKLVGSYSIDLSLAPVTPPPSGTVTETEPNDRESQANVADLGATNHVVLQGISTSDKDKDFFSITPATSGTLTVSVQATSGPTAKLEVKTAAGVRGVRDRVARWYQFREFLGNGWHDLFTTVAVAE